MITIKEKILSIVVKHYDLSKSLDIVGKGQQDFFKFLYDKRNAALGDSLINFIYSCSKSVAKNEVTGLKISDTILLNGFFSSNISNWLKLVGDKKEKANAIEALILYIWLVYDFEIEEMIMNLLLKLNKSNFTSRTEEQRFASFAFSSLFDSFNILILQNN